MTQLIRYETARSALAEARSVDEVKDIRDKSEAMRAYARMAKDTQLEIDATELRLRAERRLGIMLTEQKQGHGLGKPGPKTNELNSDEEFNSRVSLKEAGIDNKLSMRAQRIGGIGEQAFEAMVDSVRDRISKGERVSLEMSAAEKRARRSDKERDLAARQTALPDKRYGVIYADPEWRFEVYSRDTGMDRAADNHYPTSSTEDICNRPVADIAADDCVLFLWATVPMLPDALRVMDAWDFRYKSHCIWAKDRIGTGYWFRNQHEILLVGTRGNVPAPAMGTQVESLVDAPIGRHSEKPEKFYQLIERYFPNLPKIELNARAARPGWDAWGYEAPEQTAA
ncbi:MAG TPA: MT-A70 family methyltransferase [Terriglobales bacterium]